MKPEDVRSWAGKLTKYEADLLQPIISSETRTLGRQLVYFSFLTFLLAGKFIDVKGGLAGIKFNPAIFPIATFIAGLCCIYFLFNFGLYSIIDYKKWKIFLKKINSDSDSPIEDLKIYSESYSNTGKSINTKLEQFIKLLDDKREQLGIGLKPSYNKTVDSKLYEAASKDYESKLEEYFAYYLYLKSEADKLLKISDNSATLLKNSQKDMINAVKRNSIINMLVVSVDIFFPLTLSLLAIFLTIYKTYLLFEISSFSKVVDQILAL